MNTEEPSHVGRWLILVIFLLIVAIVGFFWWQNQQTRLHAQKAETAAAAVQLAAPTISTVSVANFPVGKAVSQKGSLQGRISGRCGNIAWNNLSPSEEANLRKLCPAAAAAHS